MSNSNIWGFYFKPPALVWHPLTDTHTHTHTHVHIHTHTRTYTHTTHTHTHTHIHTHTHTPFPPLKISTLYTTTNIQTSTIIIALNHAL
jgi:hypothetical protein